MLSLAEAGTEQTTEASDTTTSFASLTTDGPPIPTITSMPWVIINGTSVFWPTYTDYFYGPTTGPGASAVTCNALWIEYSERSRGLIRLGPTLISESVGSYGKSDGACRSSATPEKWSDIHSGPLTTLCDGIPRALGPRETATRYFPGTGPCVTSLVAYTVTDRFYHSAEPTPTCTLDTEDCIPIRRTYYSLSSSYRDAHTTTPAGDTEHPLLPWDCPRITASRDACANCRLVATTATIYYWAVTTTDGSPCQQGITISQETGTRTAVVGDKTFTSPTAYISFDSIKAFHNSRSQPSLQCGGNYSDAIIGVQPGEISSIRGHRNGKYPRPGTVYPFDFAEFLPQTIGNYTQPLIPWPQYRGGDQCPLDEPSCSIIRQDYSPVLLYPEAAAKIDPNWAGCDRNWINPGVTLVALGISETSSLTTEDASQTLSETASPQPPVKARAPVPTFV
ncbi:hypothetical protein AJ79_09466 [Helicocarpus griseus UAMH5409]|uniref:Uncharacterized protein n=1 Tax=Helicocarpus griseus UAMH5409 TaxID=1447875 RepID=A0A2B7WJM4_9EURO|nr:hypothetical protein AJ79_09466 [Helicocarpus griseus UAMH5409]